MGDYEMTAAEPRTPVRLPCEAMSPVTLSANPMTALTPVGNL